MKINDFLSAEEIVFEDGNHSFLIQKWDNTSNPVTMTEINVNLNAITTYLFKIEDKELNVIGCEETANDELISFNKNYAFIKLPQSKEKESWGYHLNRNIGVLCSSQIINDCLIVERDFYYYDLNNLSDQLKTKETYYKGKGIHSIIIGNKLFTKKTNHDRN